MAQRSSELQAPSQRDTMAEKLANPWQDKSIRFGFIAAASENKRNRKRQAKAGQSKENQIK